MIRKLFLFGILILLLVNFVSANFACGEVESVDVEPQWMKVRIYYNDSDNYANCTVSPAENKFCCDTNEIPGLSWGVGKEVKAEIFDEGYFANDVSLFISGEGYDVFPVMNLEKVIKANYSKVVFSNESKFLLNASFVEPFNFIELENEPLCECSEYEGEVEGNFGMNYLGLVSSSGQREVIEELIVAILEYFEFGREIECEKCSGNEIKRNQEADMKLEINLSHPIEGMELREYVPVGFEILETDGIIEEYSETHKLIVWNVSGKNIKVSYRLKAPDVWFFPRKYVFRTSLEEELLEESKIIVSRFFSFWDIDQEIKFRKRKMKIYSRTSPNNPLVVKFKDKNITRIAVFPKRTIKNAKLNIGEYRDLEEDVDYYSLDTNLALEDIEKILVDFRVEKDRNLSLYVFEDEWKEWEGSEVEMVEEDDDYKYYQVYIEPTKKIALVGEESWLDFFKIF